MGLEPVGVFFGRIGAQGIGCDARPSQVEPVRIPAGQQVRTVMSPVIKLSLWCVHA